MLTQWSKLGTHHLLPLPMAGWLSPERTSETLWPGAQKTFQDASGPLSLIVPAPTQDPGGHSPPFPANSDGQVLRPLPSLVGRLSRRHCLHLPATLGHCTPQAGNATPSASAPACFLSPPSLSSGPLPHPPSHPPVPPTNWAKHSIKSWLSRAWARNRKHCLGPEFRARAWACLYPFSEIPQR